MFLIYIVVLPLSRTFRSSTSLNFSHRLSFSSCRIGLIALFSFLCFLQSYTAVFWHSSKASYEHFLHSTLNLLKLVNNVCLCCWLPIYWQNHFSAIVSCWLCENITHAKCADFGHSAAQITDLMPTWTGRALHAYTEKIKKPKLVINRVFLHVNFDPLCCHIIFIFSHI